MKKEHLSEFEIQRLIDLTEHERGHDPDLKHIYTCGFCAERFRASESIHRVLQKREVEPVDDVQIERIMEKVRSGKKESIIIPILQRFVYVFAMMLVLGIIGFIFNKLDVIDLTQIGTPAAEATGIVWEYYKIIQEQSVLLGEYILNMYNRYFDVETVPVVAFTVMFLFFLAVIDRWIFTPMLRRGR